MPTLSEDGKMTKIVSGSSPGGQPVNADYGKQLSNIGNSIGNLGQQGAQFVFNLKSIKDTEETQKFKNDYEEFTRQYWKKMETNTDYADWGDIFQSMHTSWVSERLKNVKSSVARNNAAMWADGELSKRGLDVESLGHNLYVAEIKSTIPTSIGNYAERYVDSGKDNEKLSIMAEVEKYADDLINSGAIYPKEKVQIINDFKLAAQEKEYNNIFNNAYNQVIQMANPKGVEGRPEFSKADVQKYINDLTGILEEKELNKLDAVIDRAYVQRQLNKDIKVEEEKNVIDNIFIKPQKEFMESIEDTLNLINNSQVLTVKDKEEQRKKINDRVNAIKAGKVDPVTEFDPQAYNDLSVRISRNPESVSFSEIGNKVGLGTKGGITVSQSETLVDLKKKIEGARTVDNELHKIYKSAINDLKSSMPVGIDRVKITMDAMNLLDTFTAQNPDATAREYEDFFNRLVKDHYTWWGIIPFHPHRFWGGLRKSKKGELQASMKMNIETLQKEYGKVKTTEKKQYQQTATNPTTGEKVGWDGSKWVPIQ